MPALRRDESRQDYFHRQHIDIWSTKNRLLPLILASDAQRALGRAFLGELTDFVANRPLAALREEFDAGELEVGPSDWTVGT